MAAPNEATPTQDDINKLIEIAKAITDALERVAPGWHMVANPGFFVDTEGRWFAFSMTPQQQPAATPTASEWKEPSIINIPMKDFQI